MLYIVSARCPRLIARTTIAPLPGKAAVVTESSPSTASTRIRVDTRGRAPRQSGSARHRRTRSAPPTNCSCRVSAYSSSPEYCSIGFERAPGSGAAGTAGGAADAVRSVGCRSALPPMQSTSRAPPQSVGRSELGNASRSSSCQRVAFAEMLTLPADAAESICRSVGRTRRTPIVASAVELWHGPGEGAQALDRGGQGWIGMSPDDQSLSSPELSLRGIADRTCEGCPKREGTT